MAGNCPPLAPNVWSFARRICWPERAAAEIGTVVGETTAFLVEFAAGTGFLFSDIVTLLSTSAILIEAAYTTGSMLGDVV